MGHRRSVDRPPREVVLVTPWVVGCVSGVVLALAYLLICLAITVPLARGRQLRSNPLGAATAAIFLTCAVHHGLLVAQLIAPAFGLDTEQGLALRTAWSWPLAAWDVLAAGVGIHYWSLRRGYSSLMPGAQLFQDLRQREQQALELNDTVLQGLIVAKMALDMEQPAKAHGALVASIDSASRIITDLMGSPHHALELVRSEPARLIPPVSLATAVAEQAPERTAP